MNHDYYIYEAATLLIPNQQTLVYVGSVKVTDDYRIFAKYEGLNLII